MKRNKSVSTVTINKTNCLQGRYQKILNTKLLIDKNCFLKRFKIDCHQNKCIQQVTVSLQPRQSPCFTPADVDTLMSKYDTRRVKKSAAQAKICFQKVVIQLKFEGCVLPPLPISHLALEHEGNNDLSIYEEEIGIELFRGLRKERKWRIHI